MEFSKRAETHNLANEKKINKIYLEYMKKFMKNEFQHISLVFRRITKMISKNINLILYQDKEDKTSRKLKFKMINKQTLF
jgi:hypothetical protein